MVTVQLTTDSISKALEATERTLGLLDALSKLTPTRMDDDAVAGARAFLEAVKPYVREEWFASLLNVLLSLFEKKGVQAVLEHLKTL